MKGVARSGERKLLFVSLIGTPFPALPQQKFQHNRCHLPHGDLDQFISMVRLFIFVLGHMCLLPSANPVNDEALW